jgi:hypothetical protein
MEICKVKCNSCFTDVGIFINTVNDDNLKELKSKILLKVDKLSED